MPPTPRARHKRLGSPPLPVVVIVALCLFLSLPPSALAQWDSICEANACSSSIISWDLPYEVLFTTSDFCNYNDYSSTTTGCGSGKMIKSDGTTVSDCCAGYWCPEGYTCSLACRYGHYCPSAMQSAVGPNMCTEGYSCPTPDVRIVCPVGYFCPNGTVTPVECSPMSYCYSEKQTATKAFEYVFWLSMFPMLCLLLFVLLYPRCCNFAFATFGGKNGRKKQAVSDNATPEDAATGVATPDPNGAPPVPEPDQQENTHIRSFRKLIQNSEFRTAFGRPGGGVEWNDVVVKFKRRPVLKAVCGKIEASHITAIMGPSGSGKTTLLRSLAGLQKINSGSIEAGNGRFGFVHQFNSHYGHLTVRETLTFLTLIHEWDNIGHELLNFQKLQRRVRMLCAMFGLEKVIDSRVGTSSSPVLSGGEAKRLAVARELIKKCSFIILDEPTSGLDDSASLSLVTFLRALSIAGKTVILTIHQPRIAIWEKLSNLYVLANVGRVFYEGPRVGLLPYMAALGFLCPRLMNPADYVMDVVSGRVKRRAPADSGKVLSSDPNHLCDIWLSVESTVKSTESSKYAQVLQPAVDAADDALAAKLLELDMRGAGDDDDNMVALMRDDINKLDPAMQAELKGSDPMLIHKPVTVGKRMWAAARGLVTAGIVFDGGGEVDDQTSQSRARAMKFCRRCCCMKELVHASVMVLVYITMLWREKKVAIIEIVSMGAMGMLVGIVFGTHTIDNMLTMSACTIIPLSLFATISTLRQVSSDTEVGMRRYLLDFGLSPVSYVISKNIAVKLLQLPSAITFCAWSDCLMGLSLMSNFGTYAALATTHVFIFGGYAIAAGLFLPQRNAMLAMVALMVVTFLLAGGVPNLKKLDDLFIGIKGVYSINHARWYNHLLFLNRIEWWLSVPAWKSGDAAFWINHHALFYESELGTAWGVLAGIFVLVHGSAFILFAVQQRLRNATRR